MLVYSLRLVGLPWVLVTNVLKILTQTNGVTITQLFQGLLLSLSLHTHTHRYTQMLQGQSRQADYLVIIKADKKLTLTRFHRLVRRRKQQPWQGKAKGYETWLDMIEVVGVCVCVCARVG